MTVATLPGRPISRIQRWPRLHVCRRCGSDVLQARGRRQGHPYKLDPTPVLPLTPCHRCHGEGMVPVPDVFWRPDLPNVRPCAYCDGAGVRGETIGPHHVLVTLSGVGRPFDPDGVPARPWEAAHRRHRCR